MKRLRKREDGWGCRPRVEPGEVSVRWNITFPQRMKAWYEQHGGPAAVREALHEYMGKVSKIRGSKKS